MSYNIDTFKVKELNGLVIPVSSLFKSERKDWHPEGIRYPDGSVTFKVSSGCFIDGEINGDYLFVTTFNCEGEGSGVAMNYIFEPALLDSTGRMVASCVWEGGDSINKLIVDGGIVKWEDIDI